jgi:hypothetical protein
MPQKPGPKPKKRAVQASPDADAVVPPLELRINPQITLMVPLAIALGGILLCVVFWLMPSGRLPLRGLGVLIVVSDLAAALLVRSTLETRRVTIGQDGVTIGGGTRSGLVPWSQIGRCETSAPNNRVVLRGLDGRVFGIIDGSLGTAAMRAQAAQLVEGRLASGAGRKTVPPTEP